MNYLNQNIIDKIYNKIYNKIEFKKPTTLIQINNQYIVLKKKYSMMKFQKF